MIATPPRPPAESTGQSEKNPVTGAATIEPGTFHEPDQPAASNKGSLLATIGKAPAAVGDWIRTYPVLALFAGVGLGAALAGVVGWRRSK